MKFLVIFLSFFLSSCAYNSITTEPFSSEDVAITAGKSKIIFYRRGDANAKGWESTVKIDDKVVGYLPPNTFFSVDVEPGMHKFDLRFPLVFELTGLEGEFDFKSDQIYFIRLSGRYLDYNKTGTYVEIISDKIAKNELSCCLRAEKIIPASKT